MSGSIFVVSEDNKILELKESKYENEAIFQELMKWLKEKEYFLTIICYN